jgi:hypothetical protein
MECPVRQYPACADRLELDDVDHRDHHDNDGTIDDSDDNRAGRIDCFCVVDGFDGFDGFDDTNNHCDIERFNDWRRHVEWSDYCKRWVGNNWQRGIGLDSHR